MSSDTNSPVVDSLLPVRSAALPVIKTRNRATWTEKESSKAIIREVPPSLATRKPASSTRKKILKALGITLALFPPTWPFYLGGWLYWRSKPLQKSMRMVHKGISALEQGQTGIALKTLQEAHYLNPTNNDALYWLGMVLHKQQRHEEAIDALTLVSERIPGLPEVETALVDSYVKTNEPEAAIFHAQRLLDIAPYEPSTPLVLADAFEAAGNLDMAIDALEKAPIHKRLLTTALMDIHYRLGALYQQKDNLDKARHHFRVVYAKDISFREVKSKLEYLEQKNAR